MAIKIGVMPFMLFCLFLCSLLALVFGALAWSHTSSLLLPLPGWLPAVVTLLSPLTIFFLAGLGIFKYDNSNRFTASIPNSYRHTILMALDQIHTVVATAIATIALAYLFPGDILACRLEKQWQGYFQRKDAQAIRTIQDRFQCCGLRSTHDRAWPFKDRTHGDNACETQLGYQRSCFSPWQTQHQGASWMIFAAAALIWIMKVGFVHFNRPRPSWMSTAPSRDTGNYQRITDSVAEEEGHIDEGVRVQPATGFPPSNEWQ